MLKNALELKSLVLPAAHHVLYPSSALDSPHGSRICSREGGKSCWHPAQVVQIRPRDFPAEEENCVANRRRGIGFAAKSLGDMASEIYTLSRTVGCGGSSLTKCGVLTESLTSRKLSSPQSVDFRFGKSWTKGMQGRPEFVRSKSLQTMATANHASQETQGFFGAITTTESPCSQQQPGIGSDDLGNWLEKSLIKIIRHLPDAPFLQLVTPSGNLGVVETQTVSEELFDKPESWGSVKQCLLDAAPEGMILVHRLDEEALSECCMNEVGGAAETSRPSYSLQSGGCSTDVWGVLVHGCRMKRNACYILKTTQVASSCGILTHFCVFPAKCFGPSLKSQLQSFWLL